jgi:opacity protein-like surface antigen
MRTLICTLLITLFSTLILNAGGKEIAPVSSDTIAIEDDGGFYVGGAYAHFGLYNTDAHENLTAKALTLIAGYEINRYLSIEGRYTQSSDVTYHKDKQTKPLTSHYTDTALYAKIGYPMGSIAPYALIGYGRNTITNLIGSDRTENSIHYGAGLTIKATESLSLFADYVRAYQGKGFDGRATTEHQHINLLSAGIIYKF